MSVSRVYRVGTPYNGSELAELDYEQSADTMYLAHLNHPPTKLVRAGHTDWTFSTITFGPTLAAPTGVSATVTQPNTDAANAGASFYPTDATYGVTAIDDDTGQESRLSTTALANNDLNLVKNYNTIAWSAVTGAERYRVYKAEGNADFGYIGSTSALSFRDDNIGPDLSDGPPQGENPFPTANDYPSTVAFFQQRLGWARTNNHPNAIYFSRSGEYENGDISRPLKASDALSFALVAGKVNAVNQMISMTNLLALTSDSVFSVSGSPNDGFISPTNIITHRENGRGSSRLNPLVVDNVAFYKTAVGSSVRSLGYQFDIDGYNSNDITIFSPHFFKDFDIVSWCYAAEPLSIVVAVRSDGKFLIFTWQQEQEVWGWTLCETDGTVESVCSISELGEDRVYLTVRRFINGVSRLFVERLATALWSTLDEASFCDCSLAYTFTTPTAVLKNLGHLEGKTVVALADGSVITGLVVALGTVTLPDPASKVTIGLPFTATIETLPLAQQTSAGWTIAKPQQASRVVLRVKDSRGFKVGATVDKMDEPRPRQAEVYGSPPALVTGLVETLLRPHISKGITVVVQSSDPLPLTLTEVLYDPNVSQ
jgi:hypothetical protein